MHFYDVEIIIGDDGSDESYFEDYEYSCNRFWIKYIHLPEKNWVYRIGPTKNLAANVATKDTLIFLDQESIIPSNYFTLLEKYYSWGLLWCSMLGYNNEVKQMKFWYVDAMQKWEKIIDREMQDVRELFIDHYKEAWQKIFGTSTIISKKEFDDLWGYDENIVGWFGEDIDLAFRAYKIGIAVSYSVNIYILNIGRSLYNGSGILDCDDKKDSMNKNIEYILNKHSSDKIHIFLHKFLHFE